MEDFDNVDYWKMRIKKKVENTAAEFVLAFREIVSDVKHINLEDAGIRGIIEDISMNFQRLLIEIDKAEVKKPEVKKEEGSADNKIIIGKK